MESTFFTAIDETRQFLQESSRELRNRHQGGTSTESITPPPSKETSSAPSKRPHYLTSFLYKKSSIEKKQQEKIEERRIQNGKENPIVKEIFGMDQFLENEQQFYLAQFQKTWGRPSQWHKKNRLLLYLDHHTECSPEQIQQIRNHIESVKQIRGTKQQILYNETLGIIKSVSFAKLFPTMDPELLKCCSPTKTEE